MTCCYHEQSEPVVLATGEVVARVCVACLDELPAEWGCKDCGWCDVRRLSDSGPRLILGQRCRVHARPVYA